MMRRPLAPPPKSGPRYNEFITVPKVRVIDDEGENLGVMFTQEAIEQAAEVGLEVRGVRVAYDPVKQELSCLGKKAPLPLTDGSIRLRLLVDRGSIEIFGNDGQLYMPMGVILKEEQQSLAVYSRGGAARLDFGRVHELESAWVKP